VLVQTVLCEGLSVGVGGRSFGWLCCRVGGCSFGRAGRASGKLKFPSDILVFLFLLILFF
jgi:hypothetical protein